MTLVHSSVKQISGSAMWLDDDTYLVRWVKSEGRCHQDPKHLDLPVSRLR